jgi:hypothetical protein
MEKNPYLRGGRKWYENTGFRTESFRLSGSSQERHGTGKLEANEFIKDIQRWQNNYSCEHILDNVEVNSSRCLQEYEYIKRWNKEICGKRAGVMDISGVREIKRGK